MVFAVGVVVRCFSDLEGSHEGSLSPGMAIALTSTSEAWDRFWEDVRMTDGEEDEAGEMRMRHEQQRGLVSGFI
jgi:hypothetical protein